MTGQELRDQMAALVAKYDSELLEPGPPVVVVPDGADLQDVINVATPGSILVLGGRVYTRPIHTHKTLTLRDGAIQAPPNVNDLVNITAPDVRMEAVVVKGDGTTKRGIAGNGGGLVLRHVDVLNICRVGTETQGLNIYNTAGGVDAEDCTFEGAISVLIGGASPTVPNTIPTGLFFKRCRFTRPLDWKGKNYAVKTAFEMKIGKHARLDSCTFENVWKDAQTGFGITLTPSQYGNSPETVVADVVISNSTVRECGGGVNLLGYTQHTEADRQTQQTNNVAFNNMTWDISKAKHGGQGALLQVGREPTGVVFDGSTVALDGDAWLRVTDSRPVHHFWLVNSPSVVGGAYYGIFSPLGTRGANKDLILPNHSIKGNTFHSAHNTFKANFPENTYV